MKAKMTKYAPANYGFALKEKKKTYNVSRFEFSQENARTYPLYIYNLF